jgi:hypothetical protein
MSSLKFLVAAAAAATLSLAFAQGVPPKPAANPAVGAGQRSTEGTPMGMTGTPGGGAMAQGTTTGSTAASATAGGSMSTGATMSTGSGTRASSTMNSGGGKHKQHAKRKHHKAKADRG